MKCQSDACQKAFCSAMIQRHNDLRSKHGAPALTQDASLTQSAQAYAQKLAAQNSGLVHSGGQGYGENLAYIMDSSFNTANSADCGSKLTKIQEIYSFNFFSNKHQQT